MPKDNRNVFLGNMVKIWNHYPGLAAAKSLPMVRSYIRTKLRNTLPA